MWTVSKEFRFEAAHSLPHLPDGHKCKNVHGHSYKVVVVCTGDLKPNMSWVVDYAEIKASTQPLIDQLDHQNLNDILNTHTTAENLAFWFWSRLESALPLHSVEVWETPTTCCTFQPR